MCLFDDAPASGSAIVSKTHSPCSQSCDFWEKILRYYDTKAVRSNRKVGRHYQTDRKHTVGIVNPTYKNFKRFFTDAQNDKNTFLVPYCLSNLVSSKKAAFTLAEVLITLGIIGIVAAMTIPTLISEYQDKQFKTAYKKAYSDLNQVLMSALAYNEMPYRTGEYDINATTSEFAIIKSGFKVSKQCDKNTFYECWAKGDTLCGGSCSGGEGVDLDSGLPVPSNNADNPFIDVSGRSWVPYWPFQNIYLVDTNGLAGPNRFGKDRWIFTFKDKDNARVSKGVPVKVSPLLERDIVTVDSFCKRPPCYYYTWLYER